MKKVMKEQKTTHSSADSVHKVGKFHKEVSLNIPALLVKREPGKKINELNIYIFCILTAKCCSNRKQKIKAFEKKKHPNFEITQDQRLG